MIENSKLKEKMLHELQKFALYFIFLAFFFSALTAYQRLILGEYSISYLHYGYGLIEALILSKIILIGEGLGLGEKYGSKPLIIPTLYKTIIFSFLVMIFSIAEHFITGFMRGVDPT